MKIVAHELGGRADREVGLLLFFFRALIYGGAGGGGDMTALTMMPTSISSSAISMEAPLWLFSFLRIACIFGTCLFVDLRFNGLAACCGIFPNGVKSEFGLILHCHKVYDALN